MFSTFSPPPHPSAGQACFHILEPRQSSEICNACVLLTKRFQKLPPESTKDWRHVVDVREANSSKTAARGAYNRFRDLKEIKPVWREPFGLLVRAFSSSSLPLSPFIRSVTPNQRSRPNLQSTVIAVVIGILPTANLLLFRSGLPLRLFRLSCLRKPRRAFRRQRRREASLSCPPLNSAAAMSIRQLCQLTSAMSKRNDRVKVRLI